MHDQNGSLNGKPVHILLVEDDPADQELTRRAFKKGKIKNDFHIVNDGEEALDYLFRRGKYEDPATSPRPQLVLLDLNLPKIEGKDVLAEIRKSDELRCLPVIALTTSKQEEDILRTYDLGVNSYIAKPVTPGEFMKVVESLENYWFQIVILPPE